VLSHRVGLARLLKGTTMPRSTDKPNDVGPFPAHATLTLKITIYDKRVLGFLFFGKQVGHLPEGKIELMEDTDVKIKLEANELYIPPQA
jgi:hypothetical protein